VKQTVTLPFPNKKLNPNASRMRGHWAKRQGEANAYKRVCGWAAVEQKIKRMDCAAIKATLTFCPPDNRRRDLDNMLAASKTGLDAVSEAIGVDDSRWELTLVRGEPRPKHGEIILILEGA
jgi:crossover junction endodeoxyribonuclease RusA